MKISLSERVRTLSESGTLKMSERAGAMVREGKKIYNLTAGELPFRPPKEFVQGIQGQLNALESYHYSPVAGIPSLREQVLRLHEQTRNISLDRAGTEMGCMISHGGKHALANVFTAVLNPEDEVILMSPYWTSYPEQVKVCGGTPVVVETTRENHFTPELDRIRNAITSRTKIIVVNSPHNPTGIHYSAGWMEGFADLMKAHPEILIISDEIYYLLGYREPSPVYYYQKSPGLLRQTVIIDGISKFFASTGLRLGWAIAPTELIKGMSRLQGQITSGANSLVQRSLSGVDVPLIENYLKPIREHLRSNADAVESTLRDQGRAVICYRTDSAFYYLLDFSDTPHARGTADCSNAVCEGLLEREGVVTAPGSAFGIPHSIRINLALEKKEFAEAMEKIARFMQG